MENPIPRFTLDGVRDAMVTTHLITTEDALGLRLTRLHRDDAGDPVLLVHGLTSSSDIFVMPEIRNLAGFLLDEIGRAPFFERTPMIAAI